MGNHVSRRDLMRWSLLGAGSIPAGALLAACSKAAGQTAPTTSSAASTTSAAPTTTAAPVTTLPPATTTPFDPATPWWLQANFAPVMDEIEVFDLEVRGALPPALRGAYVKNGSNPQRSNSPHWFFGDGMTHGVWLDGGKATAYRNKWVATTPFTQKLEFGQGVPGGDNNQSNVSALWHAGRLLTSGEVGFPYELDPATLATKGLVDFGGTLAGSFTAHPHIDPSTGRMHSFGYDFADPFLRYHIIEPDGTMSHIEGVSIPRSTMIHDFAITESDAVFWDLPVIFDLDLAVQFLSDPTIVPFRWAPEAGARLGVMPLAGGADAVQWFEVDPCYVFHHVNAFRRGDEVVVDVCWQESMFGGNEFATPSVRRWTANTATGAFSEDILDVPAGDLPTRDPRRMGREHRYGYLIGTRDDPNTVNLGGLVKVDYQSGTAETWDPGPTRHGSEVLFVPGDEGDTADDAGWLLAFVHDDATDETTLAVLDATDVTAGPVAEVVMPRRVPYGFHATWVPTP